MSSSAMSHRTVISIAAAAVLGIACVTTDALARGGGSRGGGFHGGARVAGYMALITAGLIAAELIAEPMRAVVGA
jgi:hypothetical protein